MPQQRNSNDADSLEVVLSEVGQGSQRTQHPGWNEYRLSRAVEADTTVHQRTAQPRAAYGANTCREIGNPKHTPNRFETQRAGFLKVARHPEQTEIPGGVRAAPCRECAPVFSCLQDERQRCTRAGNLVLARLGASRAVERPVQDMPRRNQQKPHGTSREKRSSPAVLRGDPGYDRRSPEIDRVRVELARSLQGFTGRSWTPRVRARSPIRFSRSCAAVTPKAGPRGS